MGTLDVLDLHVTYGTATHATRAVDGVTLRVESGSVVGLVGESGSGKSTIARALVSLAPISGGSILLDGQPIHLSSGRVTRAMRRRSRMIQMVFQDPYASLNPRRTVGATIAEGLAAAGITRTSTVRSEVMSLLDMVHLDPSHAQALPGALSGGQRQRVAIARALAARPAVLVADEITAALDVSVQAAILNLLRDVQDQTQVGMLFITHNLAVVRYVADTVCVMLDGVLVESGPTDAVIEQPTSAYTRRLVEAAPSVGRAIR
jgi:peptide/nickel transport system ATP-binding protein